MISNQILQNTIDGLHQISKIEFAVMDSEGGVLATTISDAKQYKEAAVSFAMSEAESQVVPGCQFFKVYDEQQLEFVVLAIGADEEDTQMVGKIATFQIQELMVAYKERFDRDNFIKNLLLDNLLLVDIYNRAKKLHIDVEARRVVMIVETGSKKDGDEIDRIRSVFSGKTRDFVTAVDENNIIVVKELAENETLADVHKIASVIVDTFKDRSNEIRISYGTVVKEIKIFIEERNIIAYSELGIGRLIYQLPIPLCRMFIKEIFDGKSLEDFDEETLVTINKFFENSLNVSETSRQLYIHRNTLVYRLDKLEKTTGLDLRVFEDAITFKIALMVVKYMKYMENQEF